MRATWAMQAGRRALPWLVLSVGLMLATMPAWRLLAFGDAPTLDDLLSLRCLGW